jgi:hypothetical protein
VSTPPEVALLKAQLLEKSKLIKQLEEENDKAKALRDSEEKLVVSAWYNLGSALHRRSADERLSIGTGSSMLHNQSFLARQRQVHVRRPAPGIASPSTAVGMVPNAQR